MLSKLLPVLRAGLVLAVSSIWSAAAFAQVRSDVFFAESFRDSASLPSRWSGTAIVTEMDAGNQVLKVTGSGGTSLLSATLPVNLLKGRRAVLKAKVRGTVGAANGIRVQVNYTTAGSGYTTSIPLPASIPDWLECCVPLELPSTATAATIALGTVDVTGSANFDDVSVEADPMVFRDSLDDGALGTRWSGGAFFVEAHSGNGNALKIVQVTSGSTMVQQTLPAAALSGRRVLITGQVRAEGVSAKPNSWNGIKVMLKYQTANGAWSYPQIGIEVGTFAWTQVYRVLLLPPDVVAAQLVLGLENVSGTAVFDNLQIEVNPALHADDFNDGAAAVNSRWTAGSSTLVANDGGLAMSVTNTTAGGSNKLRASVPADSIRGRRVVLRARIDTDGVSAKPNSWNGIKVMLTYRRADGTYSYPQVSLGTGVYDWANVYRVIDVPADVTQAWIEVGLELVTGTVVFDDVGLASLDNSSPYWVNPTPGYTGHSASRLRGVMVATTLDAAGVTTLASWGVNLVRWQLGGNSFPDGLATANYDAVLNAELNKLDAILPYLKAAGIVVALDLHSLSRNQFGDAVRQARLVQAWKTIAARYQNEPAIWCYDIANEPSEDGEGWFPDTLSWNELAERVTMGIREIDASRAVAIEGARMGGVPGFPALRPVRASNILYSFHYYSPLSYTHQKVSPEYGTTWTYPGIIEGIGWNAMQIQSDLQAAVRFQEKYQVALYVGEFSAVRWAPGAGEYLQDAIDAFEALGWDWSYHAFREYQGWSVEIGEDMAVTTPAPAPTQRELLLRDWFGQN